VKIATHPIYDRLGVHGVLPPLHGAALKIQGVTKRALILERVYKFVHRTYTMF
jgi:hypothetical protein